MRKKSASGVLAALRGSPYGASTIRPFACCGLAGQPFCASCGFLSNRHGAWVDRNVLRSHRVFPQPARLRTMNGPPLRSCERGRSGPAVRRNEPAACWGYL